VLLALWFEPVLRPSGGFDFMATWQTEGLLVDEGRQAAEIIVPRQPDATDNNANDNESKLAPAAGLEIPRFELGQASANVSETNTTSTEVLRVATVPRGNLRIGGIPGGGGLEGRGRRGDLAYGNGATRESEAAVERGLSWLLAHQFADGSWHFDHTLPGGRCNGYCRHAGTNASSTGATAMALLAFYGAGYTHGKGPHKEPLNKGLYYLGSRMLLTANGGDLQEGTMYAQGLSAIALCEAYAMSGDENLRPFAEQAIRFVLYAQDRKGGGWRYTPGEPGDTTMHGWQLMALKSATLAGIPVPSPAWQSAGEFLDRVQTDGGAAYGYRTPERLETTSAVGLLCRMYMGWDREREALVRGVAYLDKIGPSKTNMYYNYYATQVMHHYGGEPWKRWNAKMRKYLVDTQAQVGHEAGSWHFEDQHGNVGGRLYTTAMAVMTLEVYYRYMPLYGQRAVNETY
jgi:hypothetical protein